MTAVETESTSTGTVRAVREGQVLELAVADIDKYDLPKAGGLAKCVTDSGEFGIRANWGVGIQQLAAVEDESMPALTVLVYPKGGGDEPEASLLRFSQLVAFACGARPDPDAPKAWASTSHSPIERFLLILAGPLLGATSKILAGHLRRHYRTEEETLRARVRGRLQVGAHIRNTLAGRGHHLPCRYEEFDFDNADHRALKAALHRLGRLARALCPAGALSRELLRQSTRFDGVSDSSNPLVDLGRARFGRVSDVYRDALAWAGLILRGTSQPAAGAAPEFWLDSAKVFELFVARLVGLALPHCRVKPQSSGDGVFRGKRRPDTRPDLLVETTVAGVTAVLAIGDAKYKDVCEQVGDRVQVASADAISAAVGSADTYQLYTYMRLRRCPVGFFVVPFWQPGGECARVDTAFEFTEPPLDARPCKAFALALNMMASPLDIMREVTEKLPPLLGGLPAATLPSPRPSGPTSIPTAAPLTA